MLVDDIFGGRPTRDLILYVKGDRVKSLISIKGVRRKDTQQSTTRGSLEGMSTKNLSTANQGM